MTKIEAASAIAECQIPAVKVRSAFALANQYLHDTLPQEEAIPVTTSARENAEPNSNESPGKVRLKKMLIVVINISPSQGTPEDPVDVDWDYEENPLTQRGLALERMRREHEFRELMAHAKYLHRQGLSHAPWRMSRHVPCRRLLRGSA